MLHYGSMKAIEILYYVLAFCAIWVTVVICFLVWRVIVLIKTVTDTLSMAREQMRKLDQTVDYFKTKVDHSTSHLGGIARGIRDSIVDRM